MEELPTSQQSSAAANSELPPPVESVVSIKVRLSEDGKDILNLTVTFPSLFKLPPITIESRK